MPHFRDAQGNLHFVEREFAHLLPPGCVEIGDAEADTIRNRAPTPEQLREIRRGEILAALDTIDRKSIRAIREGDAARIADWEARARALRDELAGL